MKPRIKGFAPRHFHVRVCLARAALAQRDLRRAEKLLTAEPMAPRGTIASVEAGIVGALVADARGYATRAVDLLAGAVRLAVREGMN